MLRYVWNRIFLKLFLMCSGMAGLRGEDSLPAAKGHHPLFCSVLFDFE